MTVIHQRVRRSLVHQVSGGERVRRDLLLSSFGKPSKSASSYARMYAQENHVSTQNVAEFAQISQYLSSDDGLKGLVFVDDIIASGQTAIECLDRLERQSGDVLAQTTDSRVPSVRSVPSAMALMRSSRGAGH